MTTHNRQAETAVTSGEAESEVTRTDAPIAGTESTTAQPVSTDPATAQSVQPEAPPAVTGGTDQVPADSETTARTEPTTTPQSVGTEPPPVRTEETDPSTDESLFGNDNLSNLRSRWDHVQSGFVDDPRECVQQADGLVSDVVDELTTGFSEARSRLEAQWARGEEASTEDLRLALKRYRDFFERLLAV